MLIQSLINKLLLPAFFFWNIFSSNLLCQNHCQSDRFTNTEFFTAEQIEIDTGITYGVAIDWLGVTDTQKFHIVYPKPDIDTLQCRPFIMLIHGGGYHTEEGDWNDKNQWNELCRMLAKRGFVAATIDYRVGWNDPNEVWDPKAKLADPSPILAPWRAHQDARAALRYFAHNASVYRIDTNNIFIGGRSAGGDMSLFAAFLSEQDFNLLALTFNVDSRKILGSMDSSTNSLTDKYKIRGVINMWGPIADTIYIDTAEARAMPILMFHGTDDSQVPYKKFGPPEYSWSRSGSFYIAQRYKHLGGCYELHTKLGGEHGEDFSNEFLAEHIASFLKNVMCNTCKSAEFESTVSFWSPVKMFFLDGSYLNVIAVILLIIIIVFVLKITKRRKKNKMHST